MTDYKLPVLGMSLLTIALCVSVALLTGDNYILFFMVGLSSFCVGSVSIFLLKGKNENVQKPICMANAILSGALIMGIVKHMEWVAADISKSYIAMMMGVIMIISGNILPKRLVTSSVNGRSPAQIKATERFVGWALVLGGIGYTASYLVFPYETAKFVGPSFGAIAFLIAITRWVGLCMSPKSVDG